MNSIYNNSVNEKLLNVRQYSPSAGISSAGKLHENVKHRGITFQQVKDTISKQEAYQIFKNNQELKFIFILLLNIKMKYCK